MADEIANRKDELIKAMDETRLVIEIGIAAKEMSN